MIKRIVIVSSCAILLACNSKPDLNATAAEKGNIALRKTGDQELQRLMDTAQKEMPYLIKFMSEHPGDTLYEYFVKSDFTENEKHEHMWSLVTEYRDNYFYGFLANDPVELKNIQNGDSVKILRSEVEDWMLNDYFTNTRVGGFSMDYLSR